MPKSTNQILSTGTVLRGRVYTYTIEKVLGQGTFGITYLASFKVPGPLGEVTVQAALKEFFAKELDSRQADGTVTARTEGGIAHKYAVAFRRESQNLSKMEHPGIVNVLEAFEANGTCYYSMEYLSGGCLDDKIKGKGLPENEALPLIDKIGAALSYMHDRKVMHLDLKPKNIMLKADGSPVIIDFGLSKQYDEKGDPESDSTIGMGTPGYAPIEQASQTSSRVFQPTLDIYALGATLYKMLTGVTPPSSSSILDEGFPEEELQEKGVSKETTFAIRQAMQPRRKDRPQSVKDFCHLLPVDIQTEVTEIKVVGIEPEHGETPEELKAKEAEKRRLAEERARQEAERLAEEAEKRRLAEEKARKEAERLAEEAERRRIAEEKVRQEEERRAAQERERKEAEKKAQERARLEAERLAEEAEKRRLAEEKARQEAERLAEEAERRRIAEEKARQEAERIAEEAERRRLAEEKARQEDKERRAAEERARQEAEKKTQEKARQEEERRAAQERERQEAEKKAQERARHEAERLAEEAEKRRLAEERARQEAERLAEEAEKRRIAEEKARQEAERIAEEAERRRLAEEKARQEEERRAAQERARQEAEKKAQEKARREAEKRRLAEEKARKEEEKKAQELERQRIAKEKARIEAERREKEMAIIAAKRKQNKEKFLQILTEKEAELRKKVKTILTSKTTRKIALYVSFAAICAGIVFLVLKWSGKASETQKAKLEGLLQAADTVVFINGKPYPMVFVSGGTFEMGDSTTKHTVTLDGYYIGTIEVTQDIWTSVVSNNPSHAIGKDLPVDYLSYDYCMEFIKHINNRLGHNFALPTEAQWEYAAIGGSKSKGYIYSGSDNINHVAWFSENSKKQIHPVASLSPNELGLYDMTGNVREWCNDYYADYPSKAETNPQGPKTGNNVCLRGGDVSSTSSKSLVTRRSWGRKNSREYTGFRLVINLPSVMESNTSAPKAVGSVRFASTPSGAAIWIDGKNTYKTTPAIISGITAGKHRVSLVLSGYHSYDARITVKARKRVVFDRTLEKIAE